MKINQTNCSLLLLLSFTLCLVSFGNSASVYNYKCGNGYIYASSTKDKFYLTVGNKLEINKKYHDEVTYGIKNVCNHYPELINISKIISYSHSKKEYGMFLDREDIMYPKCKKNKRLIDFQPTATQYNLKVVNKNIKEYIKEGHIKNYYGLIFNLYDKKLYLAKNNSLYGMGKNLSSSCAL